MEDVAAGYVEAVMCAAVLSIEGSGLILLQIQQNGVDGILLANTCSMMQPQSKCAQIGGTPNNETP